VASVLEEAQRRASSGAVLATFDAPLGVPESYLTALRRLRVERLPASFLDMLGQARLMPRFFVSSSTAREWRVDQPFFSVPAGKGGLGSYVDAASRQGVNLYRRIDTVTGAKPVFITSGIPGSVGSAACALWQELAQRLNPDRAFKVWPFEGELDTLLKVAPIVVGEIYPRAAYATALLDDPPASRAPLIIAKTAAGVRSDAIACLRNAQWVRGLHVTLEHLVEAEASEDDFDACITAAALLRCVLERAPLCPSRLEATESEGAIVGTGSVNLQLPQRTFAASHRGQPLARLSLQVAGRSVGPVSVNRAATDLRDGMRAFRCPITGCDKVFQGSRGGWDGHVGSLRLHPWWHPDVTDAEERKRRFEREFPAFFR
jgi:hypothetical protein